MVVAELRMGQMYFMLARIKQWMAN